MKSRVLAYIDYGSKGNSGLYIKETVTNLTVPENYKTFSFVNSDYQYQFDGVIKTFEKYSKFISNDKIKKIYKFIDLFFSLIFIIFKVFKYRNTDSICVVSLNSPFIHYKIFAKILKKLSFNVYFILHDIVDLHVDAPKAILTDRKQILKLADGCIAHTDESYEFAKSLNIKSIMYPFPLMKINTPFVKASKKNVPNFLFIGSVRPGKGVENLVKAFNQLLSLFPCSLTIAGNFSKNYNPVSEADPRIKVINCYLSDELYSELIFKSDYVILPYTEGTNSGVLSTVVSCSKPVVCSDLPVFKDSSFVLSRNVFISNDEHSLRLLIQEILDNFEERNSLDVQATKAILSQYENNFKVSMNEAYSQIL